MLNARSLSLLVLAAVLLGCEGFMSVDDGPPGQGKEDSPTGDDQCSNQVAPPMDPDTLPACCEAMQGDAHCVPTDLVPPELAERLDTCAGGGYCVPDKAIEAGGVYVPAACTSLNGEDGVCMSVCLPEVAQYAQLLPQDICDADERCAPCISPLDGQPTGACELGLTCSEEPDAPPVDDGDDPTTCVHEGAPVIDPQTLPACGEHGDAHCLDAQLVPAEMRSQLGPCAEPTQLCVPDLFLVTGGDFLAPTCRSLADAEGRCLSRALPQVKEQEALLPQSSCAPSERCVPCYNPLDGADTGACRLSCDTGPAEAPTTLPKCCDGRATCVPTGAVPADQVDNLEEDSCEDVQPDAYLCVPDELLDPNHAPPACSARSLLIGEYTGVCLSDCLDFGLKGLALARGDCAPQSKCVPCVDPLSGQPTGACDP